MSKKTKQNKQPNKLFDKKADIVTDQGHYHIRKNRIYICGQDYYGKVYTISSNKYNKNNVHIIKEIYPEDKDRFRFLLVNFKNARKFKTIEHLPDGSERKIAVIEKFDDISEYVCSIGNIKSFDSDLQKTIESKDKHKFISKENIKKLILKREENKSKDKNKKKVA